MSIRMKKKPVMWMAVVPALILSANVTAQQAGEDTIRDQGRELARALFAGETETVADAMESSALEEIGGPQALQSLSDRLAQLGAETQPVEEAVYRERQHNHYYRVAGYENAGATRLTTHFAWNTDNRIVGVSIRPVPASLGPADPSRWPDQKLRLPFEGEWYVQWGGDLPHENYHVSAPDQQFANDFLVVKDNRSHEGEGTRNSDYHCFGRTILAPAGGKVVRAADGVADNTPGEMNRDRIFGNHVVIEHGDELYSVLTHLRHDSVSVETGEAVSAGDPLGECGNSGHSSEPHLHYHLQDNPEPGSGQGLPAPFSNYRVNGEPVERERPVRGKFIHPTEPSQN